jgi:hypothetical protein
LRGPHERVRDPRLRSTFRRSEATCTPSK